MKDAIVDVFLLLYRVHLVLPALKDLLEHLVLLWVFNLYWVLRSFCMSSTVSVRPTVPPTLVSPDCDLFRVQMVSLVPEVSRVCSARRETKDPGDSLDLQAQLGCRCGLQRITSDHNLHLSLTNNMIKPSVLFSGLAWSTWWERWNWRRWSNGELDNTSLYTI